MKVLRVLVPKHKLRWNAVEKMIAGIERCGDEVEVYESRRGLPAPGDVLVTWGKAKTGDRVMATHSVCMEQGFVGDRTMSEFYVGFSNINGAGMWIDLQETPEKWLKLPQMKLPQMKQPSKGRNLLLCGQCPGDENIQDIGWRMYCIWLEQTIERAKRLGWKVRWRNHPRHIGMRLCTLDIIEERNERSREVDLKWADCVMAWSSNILVEAALEGLPVIAGSPMAMSYPISGSLRSAYHPPLATLDKWFRSVTSAQWSTEELENGNRWLYLTQNIR